MTLRMVFVPAAGVRALGAGNVSVVSDTTWEYPRTDAYRVWVLSISEVPMIAPHTPPSGWRE